MQKSFFIIEKIHKIPKVPSSDFFRPPVRAASRVHSDALPRHGGVLVHDEGTPAANRHRLYVVPDRKESVRPTTQQANLPTELLFYCILLYACDV